MGASRTMLVAGLSGLVGYATAKHFAALPDWDVIAVSRRIPEEVKGVQAIEVDLLDQEACNEIFRGLPQVTNIVYAALIEKPGLVSGWRDREQFQKNDTMLRNLMDPLQKVSTGLQHVSLLQGTKAYGLHVDRMRIPARENSPRHPHENFYWLHEDYLREQSEGKDWSWTAWYGSRTSGRDLRLSVPGLVVSPGMGQPLHDHVVCEDNTSRSGCCCQDRRPGCRAEAGRTAVLGHSRCP